MTAHANLLTVRATQTNTRNQATEAASHVRVYIEALGRLGYRTGALLEVCGLKHSDLDDPDGRVPCAAIGAMFGRAIAERHVNNLAFRLASQTPIGAFPLIDYLILTSECVSQGLEQLARYFRLIDFPVTMHFLETDESVRAYYEGLPSVFGYEFGITLCLLHLREETEGRFQAESVSFMHQPDDVVEIENALRCPVRTQAAWNGWTMSRHTWSLPLRRRDPILRSMLQRQADEMMARLRDASGTALEVRRVLVSRIAGGDTRIESVARVLATSARSLQRRLSAEGLSYQILLEETRKEAAQRYLSGAGLPIAEVAYLLGYSEAAAFHRAFKRWTGMTPQAFRQLKGKCQ